VREEDTPGKYHYTYPNELGADYARALYWDLMDDVRRKPIMRKFTVSKYVRIRY